MFGPLQIWKKIKFSDTKGLLYGGLSVTFKEKKKPVIELLNK